MSISALVFIAIYAAGLILAFRNPVFGLCSYMWAFYNHPPSRWWGSDLPNLRWSLLAAAVTIAAYLIQRSTTKDAVSPEARRPVSGGLVVLSLFASWMWVQSLWAVGPDLHLEGCILFTKYVVLVFLIERLIVTDEALDLFAWTHVGGCFLWSWLAYTSGAGGRVELEVGPGVSDSNTLGFHLVTGLAFSGIMLVALPQRRRFLSLGMIPFILNGVILTASRGAILAMAAGALGVLMFAPRRRRWMVYSGALLGVLLFLRLAGSELFWERMGTLRVEPSDQTEASAASRVEIAQANWSMFLDHPIGVGSQGNVVLSPTYIRPELLSQGRRSAHNTFLAILIDEGAPGLFLFLVLLSWAAVKLFRLRRLDRDGLAVNLGTYRAAVAGSLLAYVIAGMFSNFVTAEVGVWLVALVSVLDHLSWVATGRSRAAATAAPLHLSATARWATLHPVRQD